MADKHVLNRPDGVSPGAAHVGGGFYEIRVTGQLNPDWADWLEGLTIQLMEPGDMLLTGPVVDQAALLGILNKLYRLNLSLVSVNQIQTKASLEEK